MLALIRRIPRWTIVSSVLVGLLFIPLLQRWFEHDAPLSDVLLAIQDNRVLRLELSFDKITGFLKDGRSISAFIDTRQSGLATLTTLGIRSEQLAGLTLSVKQSPLWISTLLANIPYIILAFFFVTMLSGGIIGSYFTIQKKLIRDEESDAIRSLAKPFITSESAMSWANIVGAEKAKRLLQDSVKFLREASEPSSTGTRARRGILLAGPPGTGKTLLARALATELQGKFFFASGPSFVELYVGRGAARIRELFATARASSPSVVFIDEIDAVGSRRQDGVGGSREYDQTLNQLLIEMDGFENHHQILILAATNRPASLDPALTRPGRFDLTIMVETPTYAERLKLIDLYGLNKNFDESWDAEKRKGLARQMTDFTGADIEAVMNEASLAARSEENRAITSTDVARALETIQITKNVHEV